MPEKHKKQILQISVVLLHTIRKTEISHQKMSEKYFLKERKFKNLKNKKISPCATFVP